MNLNITMEQMIDKLVGFANKMQMTQTQAREMVQTVIPKLKKVAKKSLVGLYELTALFISHSIKYF